jgi:ubiquitin-protein ligase
MEHLPKEVLDAIAAADAQEAAADRDLAAAGRAATAGRAAGRGAVDSDSSARAAKILRLQLQKANQGDMGFSPNVLAWAPDENLRTWIILVAGLGGPAAGGEFMFALTAPPTFPASPPSVVCLTPNGVYDTGMKICVSIGEFHPGNWRPALGMAGFAREIAATIEEPGEVDHGIGVLGKSSRSVATRRALAAASVKANAAAASAAPSSLLAGALAGFASLVADPTRLTKNSAANALRLRLGIPVPEAAAAAVPTPAAASGTMAANDIDATLKELGI